MTEIENISNDERLARHASISNKYLPNKKQHGYYAIHSLTKDKITIPEERLNETFLNNKLIYSESLTYADPAEFHPDGVTRAYKPKDQSGIKTTSQITSCYFDGHIVTDGYIDIFLEDDDGFNPYWFIYKIQRHLQLTKEVMEGIEDDVICITNFNNIEQFKWELFRSHRVYEKKPYVGYHHDIIETIDLSLVYGRGDNWNLTMDVSIKIMRQVARIFGMADLPQTYWNSENKLEYPLGLPGR